MNEQLTFEEAGQLAPALVDWIDELQRELIALRQRDTALQLELSTSNVTIAAMAQALDRVHAENDALQAWKDAVPVGAIRVTQSEIDNFDKVNSAMNSVDAWLDSLDGAK